MEGVSALLRAAEHVALACLLGGAFFQLWCCPRTCAMQVPDARMARHFLWLALLLSGCAGALFVLRAAQLGDGRWPGLEPMRAYAFGTHVGRVASLQLAGTALLLLPLSLMQIFTDERVRRRLLVLTVMMAALLSLSGPLAGHAAADPDRRWPLLLHMLHLLAVSLWLGALPFWIARVLQAAQGSYPSEALQQSLLRFSRLATLCMLLLLVSGLAVASRYIDTQGDLLGTRYGLLVCAKLALLGAVLLLANRIRTRLLPALVTGASKPRLLWAARLVSWEWLLGLGIVVLAALLAQTTPAQHEQAFWWLSRRLSLAASWPQPNTPTVVMAAAAVTLLSVLALRLLRATRLLRLSLVALAAAGLVTMLWQLSVPAYPDSYRRSTVPYLTVSIDEGQQHFRMHCTACHGPGGLGDGPLATRLPKRPANLSEPHTALHTAGDMYWWLSHGIAESGMPAFAGQLDEQARWDTINFLRAFSQGFQSRVLEPQIVPRSPWLGAPNFYFEDGQGSQRELKDYREQRNVLLVLVPARDAALARAKVLAQWAPQLHQANAEVLLVTAQLPPQPGLLHVEDGSGAIQRAYELLSRTYANRGDGLQLGLPRPHMEFLIDRFGYIRARWIPGESKGGWAQVQDLLAQLQALQREPRLLPPPDDHVH